MAASAAAGTRRKTDTPVPPRWRHFSRLLPALADPGQAPASARAGLGVHQALKIADLGADGDFCVCGMHFSDLRSLSAYHDSVRISFK
jgi:hypothetical protein